MNVKNDLARTWKETVLSRYFSVGTEVNHKDARDSMCPGRDLNLEPHEYESSVPLSQPARCGMGH
jgi:hypothetical protein